MRCCIVDSKTKTHPTTDRFRVKAKDGRSSESESVSWRFAGKLVVDFISDVLRCIVGRL